MSCFLKDPFLYMGGDSPDLAIPHAFENHQLSIQKKIYGQIGKISRNVS